MGGYIQKRFVMMNNEPEYSKKRGYNGTINYIKFWANKPSERKLTDCDIRLPDYTFYRHEARKYMYLQNKMNVTPAEDYSTRNAIAYKMRVIEDRFAELLNKKHKLLKDMEK